MSKSQDTGATVVIVKKPGEIMHPKQSFFFEVFSGVFVIVLFHSLPVYANPVFIYGMYGFAGFEVLFFIPTIIIEYLIIKKTLKGFDKDEILKDVIFIHFISYPLTVIFGFFIWIFAEIIPITIEYIYYLFRFRRFDPEKVEMVIPTKAQIWAASIRANLATFILGIAATIFIVSISPPAGPWDAKQDRARMDIATLETALKLYKLDTGAYPSMEQGLEVLLERPANAERWREGGYLEKQTIPKDPWGNDYVYVSPGKEMDFEILSYGADGKPGGEGLDSDIDNRQEE